MTIVEISEFLLVLQFISGNNYLQSIDREGIGRHSLFKKKRATKNVTVLMSALKIVKLICQIKSERSPYLSIYSGALARAKRERSGAPWVRKCGKLSNQENLVMT